MRCATLNVQVFELNLRVGWVVKLWIYSWLGENRWAKPFLKKNYYVKINEETGTTDYAKTIYVCWRILTVFAASAHCPIQYK